LTIRAYLNVCSTGLDSLPHAMEQVDPASFDTVAIREMFQEYGRDLLGLKLRTSREIVGQLGYAPLRKTVELADKLGVSVMVHCTNPPGEMAQLLECLRAGDVITHMYMNKGDTILDDGGQVSRAARKARERGVLFEAADARAHFSFAVSERAIAQGFYPDIIATDLTKLSMYLRPTAFSMSNQLSKYEFLGIPFEQVIAMCTSIPAAHMGLVGQIGCLTVGTQADIAVFQRIPGLVTFGDRPDSDPAQLRRDGTWRYSPMLTVKKGEVVYRNAMF
jgi:dihydroorotase